MILPEIDPKILFALLAISIEGINIARYLFKTFKGVFKPHLFSWLIWALLNGIVFAAQFSKDAGPGMWQTACMTAGLIVITAVACLKGDKNYTRSDWVALLFALSAIPLWMVTNDPLWSVILITIIDVVATLPTMRKAYARPHEESARAFFTAAIICTMGILALNVLTVTTTLYTGTIVVVNCFMTAMIIIRRRSIPAPRIG